jgi:hypothetical protein
MYLYRAVNFDGKTIGFYLRENSNSELAKCVLKKPWFLHMGPSPSGALLNKQEINAKSGPILLYFHGNNYYMLVGVFPVFPVNLLVAHLLLFYIKRSSFMLFSCFPFNMENTPTPTTPTLIVHLAKDKIYKHRWISFYKTVHTTNVFPHM